MVLLRAHKTLRPFGRMAQPKVHMPTIPLAERMDCRDQATPCPSEELDAEEGGGANMNL